MKGKTVMKRIWILALALLLLLPGCAKDPESEPLPHSIRRDGCQIGDMIVLNGVSGKPNVYSAAFDRPAGLCRDPLCDHSGKDGPCPDSFPGGPRTFCTDGEKLYMRVWNIRKRREGRMPPFEIYALDPLGTEPLTLVCETENTGNFGMGRMLSADSRYIYYQNSVYREGADPKAEFQDASDQCFEIRRVKKTGGKSEVLFDDLPVSTCFSVDETRYFLFEYGAESARVIDRETDAETEVFFGGLAVADVLPAEGRVFFLCREPTVSATVTETLSWNPVSVFEYSDTGESRLVAEHADEWAEVLWYDGRLWYTPFVLDFLYTADLPTGRGSETERHDVYVTTDGTLCSVDPKTCENHRYRCVGEDGEEAGFIGFSGGGPIGVRGTRGKDEIIVKLRLEEIAE